MFHKNRNLLIIALVVVVNALGYGIVIPVIYSYSQRFGLSDFQNGLLFAAYSICQFISTPIIGRMSDKWGRRPLLITSLAGTFGSFLLMAFAPNAIFLFLARALDGLTAGNLPVAQAVIADTTDIKNRAKGFGIIGASFGFGFVFGPAISALTVGISAALPFLIAAAVSLVAVIATVLFLPETNQHMGEIHKKPLFDFKKLYQSLFYPTIGRVLLITLFYFLAFSAFLYAFQPYLVKVLHMSPNQISILFTAFGVVGLIVQTFLVQPAVRRWGMKKTFSAAIFLVMVSYFLSFISRSIQMFVGSMLLFSFANSLVQPLVNTILSEATDERSQGSILGLNASYMSIGQIIGPIMAGAVATVGFTYPFLVGMMIAGFCWWLSLNVLKTKVAKEAAF